MSMKGRKVKILPVLTIHTTHTSSFCLAKNYSHDYRKNRIPNACHVCLLLCGSSCDVSMWLLVVCQYTAPSVICNVDQKKVLDLRTSCNDS